MIPYGRQTLDDDDVKSVVSVLNSDFLTQGKEVPNFEADISEKVKSRYATAVNSATSALHIACLALDLKSGDYLWTTPISFVASANCGVYCGARIDFVDIDLKTFNISIPKLEAKLLKAKKDNCLPKILVVVHMAGTPCEMDRIKLLSDIYGFKIIEDASHAMGARYNNELIGNCKYSNICVFSLHPVKIITSAEGGIALTNDRKVHENLQLLRSHGITRDKKFLTNKSKENHYYEQVKLGFNYRLSDLHAALGRSQLQKLDVFIEKRQIIATQYSKYLNDLPLILPFQVPKSVSAFHLYVVLLSENYLANSRDIIYNKLHKAGIGVNIHYIPIHTQPFYSRMGFAPESFPNSIEYYRRAISLPIFPSLKLAEQNYIVETLTEIISSIK